MRESRWTSRIDHYTTGKLDAYAEGMTVSGRLGRGGDERGAYDVLEEHWHDT
jgi:hypothetical protein